VRYALDIGIEQGSEVIVYYVISVDGDWYGDPYDPASVFVPRQKNSARVYQRKLPIGSARRPVVSREIR
jgi:hypothetical protein